MCIPQSKQLTMQPSIIKHDTSQLEHAFEMKYWQPIPEYVDFLKIYVYIYLFFLQKTDFQFSSICILYYSMMTIASKSQNSTQLPRK